MRAGNCVVLVDFTNYSLTFTFLCHLLCFNQKSIYISLDKQQWLSATCHTSPIRMGRKCVRRHPFRLITQLFTQILTCHHIHDVIVGGHHLLYLTSRLIFSSMQRQQLTMLPSNAVFSCRSKHTLAKQ